MDLEDCNPVLISSKTLKDKFEPFNKIIIKSDNFTIGRGLNNSAVIAFIYISRNHCVLKKNEENKWIIEDNSACGIEINGKRLGKGKSQVLSDKDLINLEPLGEFMFKFISKQDECYELPKKKMKLETDSSQEMIDSVKMKFEASQSFEIKHIENKIQNAKQMQTTSMILKDQLQLDMNRKIHQLEDKFKLQIENLKGEKNEVEKQKMLLIGERDMQLAAIRQQMEGQIAELMEQIKRHNETESELLKENNFLKENLLKEREEFLAELNRESSSKMDMLETLELKIKEQEEIRLKEKQELQELLHKETEQLKMAKEKELKELEEQKRLKELELKEELNHMKKNLEEQIHQTEQEKLKAELTLAERIEEMKKLSDEEKVKMDQLVQEREEIQKQLTTAHNNAEASLEQLKLQVTQRETELAALAADRIQQQAEQSSEVIKALQEQLERVTGQLQSVETEKNTLLESFCLTSTGGEGNSKDSALAEVGELMEMELQCSICAELFVSATTLNCSHTFCRYCINMWKKKKKICPNCRAPIKTECKSLALDTFIEKMVQNLSDEMKQKRRELLRSREAEIAAMPAPRTPTVPVTPPPTTPFPPIPPPRITPRRGRARTSRSTNVIMTTTTTTTTGGAGAATATQNQIPIVDLTMIPVTPSPPPPPTHRMPLIPAGQVIIDQGRGQTWLIVQAPYGVRGRGSRAVQVLTTVATGAVTSVAPAAIGRPGAPSERRRPT